MNAHTDGLTHGAEFIGPARQDKSVCVQKSKRKEKSKKSKKEKRTITKSTVTKIKK